MNMHALCSAFRGVREQGVYSRRHVEGTIGRGRGGGGGGGRGGGEGRSEREAPVRGRDGDETERRKERGRGGKEGTRARGESRGDAGVEKKGGRLRLLICIRKTKGVGRAVCPSFRVTKNREGVNQTSPLSSSRLLSRGGMKAALARVITARAT